MGWDGIGTAIGWIFDRLPNKKEGMRDEIDKIKNELESLQTKKGFINANDSYRYVDLNKRLSALQKKLSNI